MAFKSDRKASAIIKVLEREFPELDEATLIKMAHAALGITPSSVESDESASAIAARYLARANGTTGLAVASMTEDQRKVAKMFGFTPEQFVAQHNARMNGSSRAGVIVERSAINGK